MSVVDAYAIVAAMVGEPAAAEVEALLRDREDPPLISAIDLAEVIDVSTRILGYPGEQVLERTDWLLAGGLTVVAVDEELGRTVGRRERASTTVGRLICRSPTASALRRHSGSGSGLRPRILRSRPLLGRSA